MATSNFKVIIIGAGPAGLSAAHSLALAGNIDFIVLERRDRVFEDAGASLVLSPPSMRIMEQFGLLDSLLPIGGEIVQNKTFDLSGRELAHSTSIQLMRKNHGIAPVAFHRAQLVQAIYDGLSDECKSKIVFGRHIESIDSNDEGVTVRCADNTIYQGDMVIGADGAHSQTRRAMRKLALATDPAADWDSESPYVSEYRCMWSSFPRPTASGSNFETQHKDRSVMYITGSERAWIFLYEKLPQKTSDRARYTDKDVEEMAARFADYPINETMTVQDAFAQRTTAGMSNLEEGIVKHWSFGRIALVGDACHKFTPNAGAGFNAGLQDVVALCNRVHAAVKSNNVTIDDLASLFHDYQDSRKEGLLSEYSRSLHMTRMQAWSNMPHYIMSCIMRREIVQNIIMNWVAAPKLSQSFILDYAPAKDSIQGAVPWVHRMALAA
ncbi:hypothetical protein jhhlp_000675 [Lomentospora prolificans]|uniref:FAD-binding domain-containing protein n=1 Tax=Lomentospora prolificans TaxID=41688 RepID=A0A2N3NJ32_9PEZI|nr:hypothetical protein jhhlp_000675 [Lomentospora prolificans]